MNREILEVVDLVEDEIESCCFRINAQLKTINSSNVDGALELYQELLDASTLYKRLAVDLLRTINEKEKHHDR